MIKQVVALISVVYVLFQKKKLPRPLTRLAARFYFWPTIPITISRLRMVPPHEYWSDVDATLLVENAAVATAEIEELRPLLRTVALAETLLAIPLGATPTIAAHPVAPRPEHRRIE